MPEQNDKITWRKFAKDLYLMFCSKDGQLSIRRVLAVVFAGALVHMGILHITTCKEVQEAFIWAFVSLIVALLGLTTWQNLKDNFPNNNNNGQGV